ncbi:hypothetical protein [Archangium sp.]|uniref:hypothetical protein n=1 Tax=Archangium sp. TaxID=1872627 RepID=UPI00286B7AFA|nr:hypothetical protein [Archangium sp.]
MNGHEDEAWLDSMLQRRLPPELPEEGFPLQVLDRLPPPERPWLRAFLLCVTWLVALAVLLLSLADSAVGAAAAEAGNHHVVAFSLGAALVWYVADRLL